VLPSVRDHLYTFFSFSLRWTRAGLLGRSPPLPPPSRCPFAASGSHRFRHILRRPLLLPDGKLATGFSSQSFWIDLRRTNFFGEFRFPPCHSPLPRSPHRQFSPPFFPPRSGDSYRGRRPPPFSLFMAKDCPTRRAPLLCECIFRVDPPLPCRRRSTL